MVTLVVLWQMEGVVCFGWLVHACKVFLQQVLLLVKMLSLLYEFINLKSSYYTKAPYFTTTWRLWIFHWSNTYLLSVQLWSAIDKSESFMSIKCFMLLEDHYIICNYYWIKERKSRRWQRESLGKLKWSLKCPNLFK